MRYQIAKLLFDCCIDFSKTKNIIDKIKFDYKWREFLKNNISYENMKCYKNKIYQKENNDIIKCLLKEIINYSSCNYLLKLSNNLFFVNKIWQYNPMFVNLIKMTIIENTNDLCLIDKLFFEKELKKEEIVELITIHHIFGDKPEYLYQKYKNTLKNINFSLWQKTYEKLENIIK